MSTDEFKVVVSIKPVHSLVAGLMKDVAEPVLLMDGDKTPFDFTLDSNSHKVIEQSSILIWVGRELERSIADMVSQLPQEKVVELLSSPRMKVLPSRGDPELRDPFFWMDDRNMIILLDELTQILVEADPSRAHVYTRNRRDMMKPLQRIDKEYEYGYRGLKAGVAVMYYDTLRYFEQAYALKTLAFIAATPWREVQANRLLQVRRHINGGQAKCLLVDKSMYAHNIDLVLQDSDINVGELDVLGLSFDSGPDLYIELMNYNTDVIKRCLDADMASAAKARHTALSDEEPARDGVGSRFFLRNQHGQTFTDQDMRGQYSLVYFGYTHCPDICPTGLSVITQALAKMEQDDVARVQPIFVSVDPERDTIQVMKDYVRYFDSRMIGLTGTIPMIKRVADQFKVKFEKVPSDIANPQEYAMDHSAGTYLMAPDGSFVTKFAQGITADAMAQELRAIIR